ncbi:MAG TPA: alpha/beta hydrolase [Dehalococcoidia bacterium]|nr:alpha/beta hydrolase [Dehalococcoidia bacterium]
MQSATVNGIRIAYQRAGSGPPLVLLHGFICDSRAWGPQIDDLSGDFDVIAWDAPGCGQSDDPPEDFTMAQFTECLAGLLDYAGVESAHFAGLSWGGTCILEFYRLHKERVRSIILADSYAGWTGSLGADAAAARLERCLNESRLPAHEWIPEWVPDAFSAAAPQSLLDQYAAIMNDFHPVGFRAMSRAVTPDFSHVLPTIGVPTLLLWGDDDRRSPLAAGEEMSAAIPDSRLVVIPNSGHVSNYEQPDRFNAEVRGFLQTVA